MPYLEHPGVWADFQLSALHKAILNIDYADLASQLELDSSALNRQDRWGRTPLYWAAEKGDCMKVGLLLQRWRADVHITDNRGRTPLHAAVESGCVESVSMLLDRGVSARCVDADGFTPLHLVSWAPRKRTEIATTLLKHDAEVDAENPLGWTPLALAVRYGRQDLTLGLLQHGADIEHRDRNGNSVVMIAIIWDHPCLVRLLIEEGAKLSLLDSQKSNVLHLAALYGSVETMDILAAANIRGVDVQGQDDWGYTPSDCFEIHRTYLYAGTADLETERPHFERLLESVQEIWYDCEG